MGIVDLRPVLGDRVDAAFYADEPTVVTKKGKPRAALIPYEWYVELLKLRGENPPQDPATAAADD